MKKFIAIILTMCILISAVYVPENEIYAETALQKAKNKKAEIEKKLQDAKSKVTQYKKNAENASSESDKLKAAADLEKAEKEVLTAQLLQLYADGEAITAAFEDAEKEYLEAEANFYENSRLMYIYSQKTPLEILAGSESISDFFKRVKLISFISEEDNKLVEELESAKQEYEYKKQYQDDCAEIINEMLENKELSLDNITLSKSELEGKISKAQDLLGEIEKQEASLKDDLKAVEAEIKKLEETQRKANEEKKNNSTQTKYTGGKLLWPVPSSSRITSSYGTRTDPFTGKKATHTGIDIGAPKGSSIVASADGTVIMSTTNGGYGKCVQIDHGGGIVTLYAHCNVLLVKVGQKVKRGDLIARVGTTGRSTGNHLHYEVRKNGSHTNPMSYLK